MFAQVIQLAKTNPLALSATEMMGLNAKAPNVSRTKTNVSAQAVHLMKSTSVTRPMPVQTSPYARTTKEDSNVTSKKALNAKEIAVAPTSALIQVVHSRTSTNVTNRRLARLVRRGHCPGWTGVGGENKAVGVGRRKERERKGQGLSGLL